MKIVNGQEYISSPATAAQIAAGTAGPAIDPAGLAAVWGRPKIYKALLTQSGEDAPTANVLLNTLGGTVVWSRVSDGSYRGTLSGAFTANKTLVLIGTPNTDGSGGTLHINAYRSTANIIQVYTHDGASGITDVLANTAILIEVYP